MKILIDTDFIIALAKADDQNHQLALKTITKYRRAEVVLSPFTIPEAVTVLSYRVSQDAARKLLLAIRSRQFTEVQYSDQLRRLTEKIFQSQTIKNVSWADCCNVAIMQLESPEAILSFDRFYSRFGLKQLPKGRGKQRAF
jgi:predicted nucleic acid-binding protein